MSKYRKKAVVIDAEQYDGTGVPAMVADDHAVQEVSHPVDGFRLVIETLEGDMEARSGDWIIRGVKGELYPCKDDIFRMTYDAADDDPPTLEALLNDGDWYIVEAFCHADVASNPCYARMQRRTDKPMVTEQISGWGDTLHDAVKDAVSQAPIRLLWENGELS